MTTTTIKELLRQINNNDNDNKNSNDDDVDIDNDDNNYKRIVTTDK